MKNHLQIEVLPEEREQAIAKRQAKGTPFLCITAISYKRIILHISGKIYGGDPKKDYGIRFVTEGWEQIFYPDHLKIESDGTFTLSTNILCSNHEEPLASGEYQMVLFERYANEREDIAFVPTEQQAIIKYGTDVFCLDYGENGQVKKRTFRTHEYPAYLSPELEGTCTNEATNPWNFMVKKTNRSWLCVAPYEDVDNLQLHFFVYYQPMPDLGTLFLRHKNAKNKRKSAKETRKKNRRNDLIELKTWAVRKLFYFFQRRAKYAGNIILFCSASRAEIGGNEKFIYDRMVERGLDQKFEFRFDFKESITTSRSTKKMIQFLYYLATSDMVVIDDFYPLIYDFDYDPRVKLIQVWHACGAFKTVGFERTGKANSPVFNSRTHKCYTHVTVSSALSARHNAESFCIAEEKFYITGIPRTDVFFDEAYRKDTTQKMLAAFPQCKGKKKVYLYAPTFRGVDARSAYFPFGMVDFAKWGKMLEAEDSVLLVKMHPFVTKKIDIPDAYKDRIFDASAYREINDILFLADVLITDYSSVIYEMSLLNKPMVFYAFDQRSYEISRDFYESYEETVPGKIVHDFDELLDCLKREDYEFEKMKHFVEKNFAYTDGKSTDRVIDQVFLDKPKEYTIAEET